MNRPETPLSLGFAPGATRTLVPLPNATAPEVNSRSGAFVPDADRARDLAPLTEQTVLQRIAAHVEPLIARIAQLEKQRDELLGLRRNPEERPDTLLRTPVEHSSGASLAAVVADLPNPYQLPAGPALDELVHTRVFNLPGDASGVPAYSADLELAKRVVVQLKSVCRVSVAIGRTSIASKPWFARIETGPDQRTEALAETLPLAVCRLALVHLSRRSPGRRSR